MQYTAMHEELAKIALARISTADWFAQLSPEQQEKVAGWLSGRAGNMFRGAALSASLANPIGEAVENHGLVDTADAGMHAVAERQAEHAVKFRQAGRGGIGTAASGTPPMQIRPAVPTATTNPAWRTGAAAPVPRGFITPHVAAGASKLPTAPVLPTAATIGTKLKLPGLTGVAKPSGLAGKLLKVKL